MDIITKNCKTAFLNTLTFMKWIFAAALVGAIGAGIGGSFHILLDYVTDIRESYRNTIFLLPAVGVIIGGIYYIFRKQGNLDTNRVIEAVYTEDKVPLVMAPLIFISTALTHLFGGSAGREGAALQLGGSIGYNVGRCLRLNSEDLHMVVMAGMAAVFTALFGTPVTAAVFAIEVSIVGKTHLKAIVPCTIASLVAYGIALLMGIHPVKFAVDFGTMAADFYVRAGVLALLCAVMGIVFCTSMQKIKRLLAVIFPNAPLRAFAGGVIIIVLTLLIRTQDYNGAGMHIIEKAMQGDAVWYACVLKIVFTAVTLGAGFKGGEIVPAFFVGSTFGCVVGGLLGLNPAVGAAIGFVALFCSAVNCPLASLFLGIEVFGGQGVGVFLLVCAVSFMMSGNYSLYRSQRVEL